MSTCKAETDATPESLLLSPQGRHKYYVTTQGRTAMICLFMLATERF